MAPRLLFLAPSVAPRLLVLPRRLPVRLVVAPVLTRLELDERRRDESRMGIEPGAAVVAGGVPEGAAAHPGTAVGEEDLPVDRLHLPHSRQYRPHWGAEAP